MPLPPDLVQVSLGNATSLVRDPAQQRVPLKAMFCGPAQQADPLHQGKWPAKQHCEQPHIGMQLRRAYRWDAAG